MDKAQAEKMIRNLLDSLKLTKQEHVALDKAMLVLLKQPEANCAKK